MVHRPTRAPPAVGSRRESIMEYNATNAAAASVTASILVLAMLYAAVAVAPRWMPINWLYVLGSAATGYWTKRRAPAYAVGLILYLGAGIVLGVVFARLYQALGIRTLVVPWGIIAGGIFWLIAGALLAGLDIIHPLTRRGDVRLLGPYGRNYGIATVMALWSFNLGFGALFGRLYQVW